MDFKQLSAKADTSVELCRHAESLACDALIVLVPLEGPHGLHGALKKGLEGALASGDFERKAGRCTLEHRVPGLKAPRLLLVALAAATPAALTKAASKAVQALKGGGTKHAALLLSGPLADEAGAHAVVRAFEEALYVYRHTKPSAPAAAALSRLTLLTPAASAKAVQAGLAKAVAIARGVELAREVANRPGNHCTPSHLASQARALGKQFGLRVDVLDRKQMEKLGMGALLAVAQGSEEPPRFIVMHHEGGPKRQAPVVLIGKGITFDTGGISLKPAAEMDEMKFDMGGAASVLGTMRAVAQLRPKLNVIGVIPSCENMPDGRAVKPGDVVTSMSGQTIEILNTDAEGRLILSDALTYVARFKPAAVVDMATLTGACVIALGHHRSALFSEDDALASQLSAAGERALDPCWRMPLDEEYDEALKSNFADMANVGGRAGGAITAAMFLRRFAKGYAWAHLDIAGSAWKSGASKGATGRPVALLTHFVLARAGT